MVVMDKLTQYAVQYGIQAVVALGIIVVGALAYRLAGNFAQRSFERQTLDPPVRTLLVRVVKMVVLLISGVIPKPVFPLQSYCNA